MSLNYFTIPRTMTKKQVSTSLSITKKLVAVMQVIMLLALTQSLTAQCTVDCLSEKHIYLDGSGQVILTSSELLQDPMCDPLDFTVKLTDDVGTFYVNSIVDCSHVGVNLTATVINIITGESCSTDLIVADMIKPSIICLPTILDCNENSDPAVIGYPHIIDNCTPYEDINISYDDQGVNLPCYTDYNGELVAGKIERTWTVTDASGNQNSCVQDLYIRRTHISNFIFPNDLDGIQQTTLFCGDDPTDLALTGQPTINGAPMFSPEACSIAINYFDQEISSCNAGTYEILRHWSIRDLCTTEVLEDIQVIKITDNTPPVITCPNDVMVDAQTTHCSSSITLPQAIAIDECSSASVSVAWDFGTGYGPFLNVPTGTYVVDYTAEDECGNTSTCSINVTIMDDAEPVAVCKEAIEVALSTDGTATVYAFHFENGSYDNCVIDTFLISLDGQLFSDQVQFGCADLANSPIMLFFRVYDEIGQFNDCMVEVTVVDNLDPFINCANDITIACDADPTNLLITGASTATDNCPLDTLYYEDNANLNDCGRGSIERTWIAIDGSGNTTTCIQTITVDDSSITEITFPDDYQTNGCGVVLDLSITGEPIINSNSCTNILVSYDDDEYIFGEGSCYYINRHWKVIDWCTYVPNSTSNIGVWEDNQLIEVYDLEAPVLNCAADITVGVTSGNCDRAYATLTTATATDCDPNVVITNNSPYANANGADASGLYPIGIHLVTFKAEDACGNESTCDVTITVGDYSAPSAICKSGIAITLMETGMFEITGEFINQSSYDDCTATENLTFEVIPSIFTCADIGLQIVELHVTDESGNSSYCTTAVQVQDNMNACPNSGDRISGIIVTEEGKEVDNILVELSGDHEAATLTNVDGYYEFPNVQPDGTYVVTPLKNIDPMNGISTFDVVLIQQHIIGTRVIESPYKLIAADVNNSGSVTAFDLVSLRKMILHIDTTFVSNDSWKFVNADFVFTNTANPFATTLPAQYTIDHLNGNVTDIDFVGIKIGDVNDSVNPLGGIIPRNKTGEFVLEIEDIELEKGKEYIIPFTAKNFKNIIGYQFSLAFDKEALDFKHIEFTEEAKTLGLTEHNFGYNLLNEGVITTSWDNARGIELDDNMILFSLKCTAKQSIHISETIQLNSSFTAAEAYKSNGLNDYTAIDELSINLIFNQKTNTEVELYQNAPNPFVNTTNIRFDLPENNEYQVLIYDISGKLIKAYNGPFERGYNEIEVRKDDLNSGTGIYYYHLKSDDGRVLFTKKMVLTAR